MATNSQLTLSFLAAATIEPAKSMIPDSLRADAIVALDEPSLAVNGDEVRDYLRARMTLEQIAQEIDAIGNLAKAREEFGDFALLGLKPIEGNYFCVFSGTNLHLWMHEHERQRMNQLQQASMSYGEAAEAARQRIKARIEARKLARKAA